MCLFDSIDQVMTQTDYTHLLKQQSRASKQKLISADLKTVFSDFIVKEVLSFEPSGSGEHLFLQIKKTDCNTDWVIRQLQKKSGLTSREIGYAGKKDRHSISTQWFSLHLPGKDISLELLADESYEIVHSIRHDKKLRVGSLKENQFEIILRNLSDKIQQDSINSIAKFGVPNYFGPQRFGHDTNNLNLAEKLLTGQIKIKNRNKRGLVISSARSFLFNQCLAKRVDEKTWLEPLKGDCMMLDQKRSYYQLEEVTDSEVSRINSGDLHISGFMPGKQISDALHEAKAKEDLILSNYKDWITGLKALNLDSSRRAYRCIPKNLSVEQFENEATLKFSLSKGCFATSVLRELVDVTDQATRGSST